MDPRLRKLVGVWRGTGRVDFPTMDETRYRETLRFRLDAARGLLWYEQVATLMDGSPSHGETGFIDTDASGAVRLWCAQSGGRLELMTGTIRDDLSELSLELQSEGFLNDERMKSAARTFRISVERLSYTMEMHTTTAPEGSHPHLEAELRRSSDEG